MLAVSLVSVSAKGESQHPRLVLAPLSASVDLEATRDAIASEVRSSVEQANAFRVVKADVVRTMITVSPSASCPQERCALRLARLVDADMVLTGEISERDGVVNVALRIYDVRDGAITHRLGFEVSTKREDLTRDVDNGVRSMLGLGIRAKPQSAASERIEMAAHVYDLQDALNQDVWRARASALN